MICSESADKRLKNQNMALCKSYDVSTEISHITNLYPDYS